MAKHRKSKIRDDNFVVTPGWIGKLDLSDTEKYIYAIIYGFSQIENQYYTGGLSYLGEWTRASERTIIRALNKLEESGYIIRKSEAGMVTRMKAIRPTTDKMSPPTTDKLTLPTTDKMTPLLMTNCQSGRKRSFQQTFNC